MLHSEPQVVILSIQINATITLLISRFKYFYKIPLLEYGIKAETWCFLSPFVSLIIHIYKKINLKAVTVMTHACNHGHLEIYKWCGFSLVILAQQ